MSLPAMALGDRFYVSRKGGTGGGAWVLPKGEHSMAVSGFAYRKTLVRGHFSPPLHEWALKPSSVLVGFPFLA